jgi:hypothetical protein
MKISLHLFLVRWRRIHGPYLFPHAFMLWCLGLLTTLVSPRCYQPTKKLFTHVRGFNYEGTQNFMNALAPSATGSAESNQYSHNLFPSVTFQCYHLAIFYLLLFGDGKLWHKILYTIYFQKMQWRNRGEGLCVDGRWTAKWILNKQEMSHALVLYTSGRNQ